MPALFSCSKKASAKARALAKSLAGVFPESLFVARADKSVDWLVSFARYQGLEFLVIVSPKAVNQFEWRGIRVLEDSWKESFAALFSLLKEAALRKLRVSELRLDVRDKKAARLFGQLVDPESACVDAEFSLAEKEKVFSLFEGPREVGPRFSLEGVSFAE